jgi:hypothetical protein
MASVPNMFGDFFGGGAMTATLQGPPVVIPQIFNDGAPLDFQVFNGEGQPGPGDAPGTLINVLNGPTVITQSIGLGQDLSGDGQLDTYAIAEPVTLAPGMPGAAPLPGPGTVVYNNDGVAVFTAGTQVPVGADPRTFVADQSTRMADGWTLGFSHTFTPDPVRVMMPASGAGVRRVKLSENGSPIPRSRVLFNYNFFNDVYGGIGDVNRYVVGWEHAMFDGWSSVEVRFPLAATLAADQVAGGAALHDTQFGDMTVTWKQVLYQGDRGLLSAGLGVAAPTAEDARLFLPGGQLAVQVENESVHLMPFVAVVSNATDRIFWQLFLQFDIDANGSPVRADVTGANVAPIGVMQDQTLVFVDLGLGYRLYEDPQAAITQVAAMAEFHYASPLQNFDNQTGNGVALQGITNWYTVTNATLGANIALQGPVNIRPAMVIPLTNGDDEHFDYEAAVQMSVGY